MDFHFHFSISLKHEKKENFMVLQTKTEYYVPKLSLTYSNSNLTLTQT